MIKRPLLLLGAAAVFISLIIVGFFSDIFYPPSDSKPNEDDSFACRIYRIEERENSMMLYVLRGRFKLLLTAGKKQENISLLKTGNVINACCTLSEWKRARNRGNFDEQHYYRSLGIYQKYRLNSFTVTDSSHSIFKEILRSIRKSLSASIRNCADEETAGVLIALATGSRTELDDESKDLFRISGIAHVLAVSGLHVSFVGMGLFRIMRKRFRFPAAACCSLLAVSCYVLMSSASASSVRALIMMTLNLSAKWFGRKADMISSMSLAIILLLISNPFYVTNSGFILSFTAIAGAAVITGPVSEYICGARINVSTDRYRKILINAIKALAVSISISAATLPVISSIYYEFPFFGPVANMVVLIFMPYIFGGALAGGIAGIFSNSVGKIVLGAPVLMTKAVNLLCRIFAFIPANTITSGRRTVLNIIIYYLIIVSAMILLKLRKNDKAASHKIKKLLERSFAMIMTYVLLILVLSVRLPEKKLHVTFIDVDQGECILAVNDTGTVYLIDAGSSTVENVYEYRIKSALKYLGINRIDYLFVTHPDTDHVSAVIECLNEPYGNMKIRNLLIPDFDDNKTYMELIDLAAQNSVKVTRLIKGVTVRENALSLECIHPFEGMTYPGTNEKSAVIMMTYGSFRAMFTGDIGSEQEKAIIKDREGYMDVDLLDVAHHGSGYSSCSEFLSALSPKLACISAGVSNSYGHPHPETLKRLNDAGVMTYCTKDCGEIDIFADRDGTFSVHCMCDDW